MQQFAATGGGAPAPTGSASMPQEELGESSVTRKAKEKTAQATSPM